MDEESSVVLYLESTSLSAVPVIVTTRLPNKYKEFKLYVPSLSPPVKNTVILRIARCMLVPTRCLPIGAPFLEWTKDNGQGLFLKYAQDEHKTTVGYLLYTHKTSSAAWYPTILSKKSDIPIASRFRKIYGKKTTERAAVHLEYARDQYDQVKDFLRIYC